MIVWMVAKRKGAAYHTLTPDRRTSCGRWYGGQGAAPVRGYMMSDATAEAVYHAGQCRRCYGPSEVVPPRVVRTGRP